MQSGSGAAVAEREDAQKITLAVAAELGVPPTAEALAAVEPAALLAAQGAVALALLTAPDPARWGASIIRNGLGIMSFFPSVDGELVTGVPVEVIEAGDATPVPLLTGATAEEFRFFTVPTGLAAAVTPETLPLVLARYGWDPGIYAVYAANRPGAAPGDVVNAMLTDTAFRAPTVRLAEAQQTTDAPVHVYEFAWQTPVSGLGACHALELPFVFDTLAAPAARGLTGQDPPQELANEMHGAWVAFARDGDPGWPRYTPESRAVMTYDTPSRVVHNPRGDELACWRAASPVS
jgi:para-nitrobenzyl esterase